MYNIADTVVGDPWAEWLTTTKRVTRGLHAWKYSDLQSIQHLQVFILTPHNNIVEYSPTQVIATASTLFELDLPTIKYNKLRAVLCHLL